MHTAGGFQRAFNQQLVTGKNLSAACFEKPRVHFHADRYLPYLPGVGEYFVFAKPKPSGQAATGGAIVPVANLVAGSWPLKTNRLAPPGARR